MTGRATRFTVAVLLTLLAAHGLARAHGIVRAHGIGTPQQLNVPAGPYLVSVWTDPDPLRVDETHVVVAVMEPETREPIVSGLTVTVELSAAEDAGRTLSEVAPTDSTNRLFYAAEFSGDVSAGTWLGAVTVEGPAGRGGPVAFEITVEPAGRVNWTWIGIGGAAAVLGIWVLASLRPGGKRGRSRP